ncbi:cytochrome P450 [Trametes polyzona]|nr:cytochrome P450 [Trametes polyzona]
MFAVTFLVVLVAFVVLCRRRRPRGLPPGPPRSILGDNTRDVPAAHPWKKFTEWNRIYGPVVSFYLGRKPVIILGTAQAAWDLLDKRSEIYSGRPRSIMAGEILSWGVRAITMSYGPRYKRPSGIQGPHSSVCTTRCVDTLTWAHVLHFPLTSFQMSVIFRVAYGRRIRTLQDDIVIENAKSAKVPGQYLVESMSQGTAQPSMATLALERQAEFGLSDLETAYTLAGPWDAGIGTVVSTIEVFLLAMLHFPDAQREAQAEIDRVIGHSRMPEFSDTNDLPYVAALIKEVTRWRPVAPTGFAHAVTQDDVYNGYHIPKGATVYANIHAIMQDPELFPDPEAFRPERFLGDAVHPKLQNFTIPFGYGRRICPGLHIANQSIYIVVAQMLWAFNIVPATQDGKVCLPSADDFTSGLITRPNPFPCAFEPRRGGIEELIVSEADKAEVEATRWDAD